ncbi:MAG: hypothetical protein H6658_17615 [Ardenticatenaceae bacterium]|nr:hypothetical protein [Ardenticatenaceae bacterium]
MSQFNWQQDAEDNWDEPVTYNPKPENPRPQRRWWLIPIFLLVIGGTIWLLLQQANQRVEEATTAVTNDLLSSHSLLIQAVYSQDNDLFTTLISGRDPKWTASQQALLPQDLFFSRPSFDLTAAFPRQPNLNIAQDSLISLDFAPDLLSAELIVGLPYTFTLPNGQVQSITLQQTAVYRLGNQRWLYAPPDDDFWGRTRNVERDKLILTYPARDEELAQRLATDLEQTVEQLCSRLDDINCPDNFQITLALTSDPDILLNLTNPQNLWQSKQRIVLPTPTLIGLPTDEAGYQALRRGYATQVATAVIAQLVEYQCCNGVPFFQTLLHYQLSQLDLRTWPVTQADYQRAYDEAISLSTAIPYWRSDNLQAIAPEDQWLIYLITDFLLRADKNSSPAFAQRILNVESSMIPWLANNVLPRPETALGTTTISREWFKTASIRSHLSTEPAPLPFPHQDLLLLCTTNGFEEPEDAQLYRYHLDTGQWQEEYDTNELALMSPLPDDTAVILQSFNSSPVGPMLWQDGQFVQSIINTENPLLSFGHLHPSGKMLTYQIGNPGQSIVPQLADLTSCPTTTDCALEAHPGLLAWSPDGRQTIIANPFSLVFNYLPINGRHFLLNERLENQEPYNLYRTEDSQQIPIGAGFEPFWIDNETYGYLRPSGSNLEIVIAKTADDSPQLLLSSSTLISLLPNNGRFAPRFNINYILTEPHHPNQLFIVATSGRNISPRQAHIYTYDLISHRISLILQTNFIGVHNLDFSPDGRYLILSDWQERIGTDSLNLNNTLLYDFTTQQSHAYATVNPLLFPAYLHDWSADGQWLAILTDENKIALTIPHTNHYQIIEHNNGPCASLAWINPIE